ncbi:MAG: hypothetical protein LBO76_00140, partial [Treponema sp.]|nr:hypothetical protein [Treponema sp.]
GRCVKCIVVSPDKFRFFLFLLLILSSVFFPRSAAAQDKPWALGVGLEGNMNTPTYAAGASWISMDRDLGRLFAAGLKTGYSYDFSGAGTLEIAALGRWYFFSFETSRLFAQLELGADLIFHEGNTIPAFLGGLAAGWRIPLGAWYLEPAVRGGYPYIWGAGLAFGRRI